MDFKGKVIAVINILVGGVFLIGLVTTFVDGSGLPWAISSAVILVLCNYIHHRYKQKDERTSQTYNESEPNRLQKENEYCYVTVRFDNDTYGRTYHYICDDWHVKTGDKVTVPTAEGKKTAKVIFRKVYKSSEVPYPLHLTKKTISITPVSPNNTQHDEHDWDGPDVFDTYSPYDGDEDCSSRGYREVPSVMFDDAGNVERYIFNDNDYKEYLSDHGYHDDDDY